MKGKKLSYKNKCSWAGFLFTLPWIIGFIFIFLRPLISLFLYSVCDLKVEIGHLNKSYIGFSNYISIFTTDAEFLPKLTENLLELLYKTPIILAFSLFISVLLNKKFIGRTIVRTIFFIPVIAGSGGVVMSIMNGDVMSQSVLNGSRTSMLFQSFSMQSILLEAGVSSEIISVYMNIVSGVFELTWRSGLQIVLFIAALQNVSPQLYEAAKVEGATSWEVFWNVTFPLITPILIVNLIYTIIDSLSDCSNGVIEYSINLCRQMQFSYSSAIATIYFLIISVIVVGVYLIVNRLVVYTVN